MRATTLAGALGGAGATMAACAAFAGIAPWIGAVCALAIAPTLAVAPGACLFGIAVAAGLVTPALESFDAPALLGLGIAVTAVATWLTWLSWLTGRRRETDERRPRARAASIALGLAVASLCTIARQTFALGAPLAGPDLPGLAAFGAGCAFAAAVGAGLVRFLCLRHPVEKPLLILIAGIAAAASAFMLPRSFDVWVAHAQALHAPDVSRTQFLAGNMMLAVLVAGPAVAALGALLGALTVRAGRGGGAAIAIAAGIAAGLAALPIVREWPAALALATIVLVVSPASLAVLVGAGAITLGVFESAHTDVAGRDDIVIEDVLAQADRVYVDVGRADAIARPADPPAPGWPSADGIHGVLAWLDAIAPAGAIAIPFDVAPLVFDLAPSERRGWFGFDERTKTRDTAPIAAAWMRATAPCIDPGANADVAPRVLAGGIIVRPLDLWRAAPNDVDAWLAEAQEAQVVLFGRYAAAIVHVGTPADPAAATNGPWTAFAHAREAPPLSALRVRQGISLARSRTRLAPALPRTGSSALTALLARSTCLDAGTGEALAGRVRLELAAATLADDAIEQERLLRLLEAHDPVSAASLRRERRAARERLLVRLLRLRVDDPTNADVRFRLGTVLARSGFGLAGIEELTACVQFRPSLVAGWEELGHAYLIGAATNQFKWTPTGALDVNYGVESLVRLVHLDRIELGDHARMMSLLGTARCAKATRAGSAAESERLRHDAIGIFRRALDLEPYETDASRLIAAALQSVGEDPPARAYARDAVARRPLDPNAHAVATIALRPIDRDAARAELERAFRTGFGFPLPRIR